MKVLVCGDRYYTNVNFLESVLDGISEQIDWIIEGEAPGADTIARNWAIKNEKPFMGFPAPWKRFKREGKNPRAAGVIRNTQMLKEGKPDFVIAFHDNIEQSKGTKNMLEQAKKANIPTWLATENKSEVTVE